MYRAEISLMIFKIVGIWPPKSLQGNFTIYHVFTSFVACLTFLFAMSNILYLFRGNYDMEKFTESFFYVLALSTACVKMIVIFQNSNRMIEITELLLNKQFAPRDIEECFIQSKFDNIGRIGTNTFVSIVFIVVILRSILPLIKGSKTSLPYNAWVPYNLENRILFWLTFGLQTLGAMLAGQATAAGDAFAVVIMLQLCSQVEILIHRMELFPKICKTEFPNNPEKEQIILSTWIQHHNSLYLLRDKLNGVYNIIFFYQLLTTTLEVCSSVYLLATFSVTSVKFWSMIFSLSSIMIEIYVFCWHGHLIIEKSKSIGPATFSIDWISLSKRSRTSLIHIIKQTNIPIKFTAGPVVPLSIDTFASILRLAYSIYNCLMRQQ